MSVTPENKEKCTDLEKLRNITKSDPKLMMEMISLYLLQTPSLINSMKQGFKEKDLKTLHKAVHTMIPSFSIMGMSVNFENMAKKVQRFAVGSIQSDGIEILVKELANVCNQSCIELQNEFNTIKNASL